MKCSSLVLMINSLATLKMSTVFQNPIQLKYDSNNVPYSYILFLPSQALLNNLSLKLFCLFVVRAIKFCQVTKRRKWNKFAIRINKCLDHFRQTHIQVYFQYSLFPSRFLLLALWDKLICTLQKLQWLMGCNS